MSENEGQPPSLVTIYGLVDPATSELRYIGTAKNPQLRLKQHLQDARNGSDEKARGFVD